MLKVVIVDDEPEIAEGIAFLIKRYNSDICEVVGIANDGVIGCELALRLQPNIIITDIRMPECDGLEMIRQLQGDRIESKFIILSGYEEFDYAKQAMQLGVTYFLTKPIDEEELRNSLVNLNSRIDQKRTVDDAYESMQGLLAEIDLRDYLQREKQIDVNQLKEKLVEQGALMGSHQFICCLIKLNASEKTDAMDSVSIQDLLLVQCKKVTELQNVVTVTCAHDCIAVVCGMSEKIRTEDLVYCWEEVKGKIMISAGVSFCVGIGVPVATFEELADSYETAELALNYRILKGDNSVILYKDIEKIETHTDIISDDDMRQLEEYVDKLDDDGYEKKMREIFGKIRKLDNLSLESLQQISLNLVLFGIRKTSAAQLQLNQYLGKNIFTLENIEKFNNIDQLENWIINTVRGMNQLMLNGTHTEKLDVVQEAKAYIRKNFNKNISLNDISERFYINPYYFSQVFKKKTGMKYQNYVIELRVDRAKKLLRETDLKLYEICMEVGYSDMNHFNHVFERVTGVKPGEYRKGSSDSFDESHGESRIPQN